MDFTFKNPYLFESMKSWKPAIYKLSVNDFVIKALALALAQVPAANVTWTEGGTLRHKYSDVGVAVAVEGGLFTPIIRHAELKSLSEISNEMRDLAERARKRRLAPHEYQGGTTSISNLGMYGIKSFDAVINPPHATILAVGAGEKTPDRRRRQGRGRPRWCPARCPATIVWSTARSAPSCSTPSKC